MAEVRTCEEYNGTSWTNTGVGSLNTAGGEDVHLAGTSAAAVAAGGYISSYQTQIEHYNGSAWSDTGADLGAGMAYGGAAGTQTDAIFFGGYGGSLDNNTYGWDGSAIETLNTMSNANNEFQSAGTRNDVILTGGGRIANNDGQFWNGTSWSASSTNGLSAMDLYSPSSHTDCGGSFAAVFFGGGTGSGTGTATNRIGHHDR